MKYDAKIIKLTDIPQLLQGRHPDLTSDEHQQRILSAVHEASHTIAAMRLITGFVGSRAYIRVPRQSTPMPGMRGMAGKVECSAENWENVIVDFSGVAGSFISDDPNLKSVCAGDIYYGKEDLRNLSNTNDEKKILDLGHVLFLQALQIVVDNWEIIDLIATAMLIGARKDGGLEGKRFHRVVDLAQKAIDLPGFRREVCFPISPHLPGLLKVELYRLRRITQLEFPCYRYPNHQKQYRPGRSGRTL